MLPNTSFKNGLELLRDRALRLLPREMRTETAVKGLMLTRYDSASPGITCFYKPMIAVIAQGSKRSMVGGQEYNYSAGECMVIGSEMPGIYSVGEASSDQPFISLSIPLDRSVITGLLTENPSLARANCESAPAVVVDSLGEDLLDAFLRLMKLLENPAHVRTLAPMIVREIHFYLLCGAQGDCLNSYCMAGSMDLQIAGAITWLRDNFRQPLSIEKLAQDARMAPSTFHRRFREMTSMSPLQFQKSLRLYEAERLMLTEGFDASMAALEVGYESSSQFSREYKRQFGRPPRQDVSAKRGK
ncbi:MAG: AraC family transcriptional regulator [Desulfovibrionaceae bacterium]|nr:AraC family transcriptional regulator [Desulfovibrionaceae bacterium]